jgi:hypothetical protein
VLVASERKLFGAQCRPTIGNIGHLGRKSGRGRALEKKTEWSEKVGNALVPKAGDGRQRVIEVRLTEPAESNAAGLDRASEEVKRRLVRKSQ